MLMCMFNMHHCLIELFPSDDNFTLSVPQLRLADLPTATTAWHLFFMHQLGHTLLWDAISFLNQELLRSQPAWLCWSLEHKQPIITNLCLEHTSQHMNLKTKVKTCREIFQPTCIAVFIPKRNMISKSKTTF